MTNQFADSGASVGFGVVAGDNLAVGKLVVGPFVSFDRLNQAINHTFTAGSFLGTTTSWDVAAGAKVGVVTTNHVLVYGLGGVSWLNHELNVNFGRGATSIGTTTTGYTFGGGAEYQPSRFSRAMPRMRLPIMRALGLFVTYQHTTWQAAPLDKPTASPTFNYAFGRSDDAIKIGVDVHLNK